MSDQNTSSLPTQELDAKAEARKLAKKQKADAKAARIAASKENKKNAAPVEKKEKSIRLKTQFVNTTPPGEKKDMSQPMASAYDPPAVEAAWYSWWVKKGFFSPNNSNNNTESREKFVMVIPPPNVTGYLHIGHALTNSVEDCLTRWHRMCGHEVLWVPGLDHAGIATQVVVEKKIFRDTGKTRHDLGREPFVNEVWKWKELYASNIKNQLQRIGSSVDWDREVFTLDDDRSRAVTEAFVRLYEDGSIYRQRRLVNWCCTLNTAIADIEVEHVEFEKPEKKRIPGYNREIEFGLIYEFEYPIENSDEKVKIATTRPETLLGDTGVAVHPDDERYKHLHGKFIIHPFNGRRMPIVTDSELVKMDIGTGVVKVTPAHDPNDFACGTRHNLEFINILNDDGTLNENGAPFQGLPRFDARDEVIKALQDKGLYVGKKKNPMSIGFCSRSKDVIEPVLKPQWWVKCDEMGAMACQAVRNGDLELIPSMWNETWYRWLDNIRDWCISRQLWWGHRIPAYLVSIKDQPSPNPDDENNWIVGRTIEEAREKAYEKFSIPKEKQNEEHVSLHQDPDVLDTWFSSGLFPFSVFNWPENTTDLQKYFPTTLLETGHDILFFWVARMVMMSMKLLGKLPFKQVFLHAIVRDAHGRKMSKALGNVVDPIDVIEGITLEGLQEKLTTGNLDPREIEKAKLGQKKDYPNGISECGTDALRFALCSYTTHGRDINLDINKVVVFRNFCNKLWNATKFALMNLGDNFVPSTNENLNGTESFIERWILSRLDNACSTANENMKGYHISEAVNSIHNFWLYELCDIFLEAMKPIMQQGTEAEKISAQNTLYTCLDVGLRLIAPFMPFVSEELFQRLSRRPNLSIESICIAPYPTGNNTWKNPEIENEVNQIMDIIKTIRSIRAGYKLAHKNLTKLTVWINSNDEKAEYYSNLLEKYSSMLKVPTLAFSSEIDVRKESNVGEGESWAKDLSKAIEGDCVSKEVNTTVAIGVLIPPNTTKL